MKAQAILLLHVLCLVALARPPSPSCQKTPLPSVIPVSIGETQRFDLEDIFNGYNLTFKVPTQDFVTVLDKFTVHQHQWPFSMNFTSAKILGNGRFLGIQASDSNTLLYVGMNDENDGVNITNWTTVERISNIRCFDIEEVAHRDSSYAIIDCAEFRNGQLSNNLFFYVDLGTMNVSESMRYSDVFVNYHMLQKRTIHLLHDGENRMDYLVRVAYRDSIDDQHKDQTYLEIFEINNAMEPYLLDVVDHTVLGGESLSIADFQIYDGLMYVLAYNRGLYELRLTRNQKIVIRSFFEIRMNVNRFWVNRLGFNDDLNVVLTNGNSIYQYDWIIGQAPTLTTKYSLMPNSDVQQLFVDENFVIVSARAFYHDQFVDTQYRNIWVFSKMTTSWSNAFLTFALPSEGTFNMHFHDHVGVLTVFGNYFSRNFKFMLPTFQMMPYNASLLNTQVEVVVTGYSYDSVSNTSETCSQHLNVIIINGTNQTIFGTGLLGRTNYVVDAPDERQLFLGWSYFGPNIKYNATFENQQPSSYSPNITVLKTMRYIFKWNNGPNVRDIVFVDMFNEPNIESHIYGLVQDVTNMTYYISCSASTIRQEMNCETVNQRDLERGRITNISQIIDSTERRVACTFDQRPEVAYVYMLTPMQIRFYGSVSYLGVLENQITSVSILNGMLLVTFKLGKRVDVYRLEDIQSDDGSWKDVKPIFRITAQVMRFMGVPYFAPVDAQTNPYHLETLFLKTKTGLMAISINEMGFPELLFQIPVFTDYSYEISRDSILIITERDAQLYRLTLPLSRNSHPFLNQVIQNTYKLGEYNELVSDQLFYMTDGHVIQVLHPDRPSTSIFFDKVEANAIIRQIDAVKLRDREYVIALDLTGLSCWEFYFEPKILLDWDDGQPNFNLSINAYNNVSTSNVSQLNFTVFNNSESVITPGPGFNQEKVNKLVQFPHTDDNNQNLTISFADKDWFNGSVLHYAVQCQDCGNKIHLVNHISEIREIVAARAILDIESTYNGVFALQFDAIFKTYLNDSIQFVTQIPTNIDGEPCVKIAVPFHQVFTVSLCETGKEVNMYLTSYITQKPFTWGPSQSEARQVNSAKMVDMVLMIVDNEDNPFLRQGGVYLYHLDLNPDEPEQFALLDLIESDDLQIEGFSGFAFITSADMHKVDLRGTHYRLVMTEGRTGGIFIFTFELSPNKQEVIYLSKKYINIHKFFLPEDLIPDPLRIYTVSILEYEVDEKQTKYVLLLTVANWHHIEVQITLSVAGDSLLDLRLLRLYERYPWPLKTYVKYKPGRNGFFAVPYFNGTLDQQMIVVYDTSRNQREEQTYNIKINGSSVQVVRLLGAHRVRNTFEVSYDFNETNVIGYDNMLFVDIDAYNLTELKVDRNLTLLVNGVPSNQTIKLVAQNTFHNTTFDLDFGFGPVNPNPDEETVEIIWIIILIVGFIMVVGLILVCVYQIKKEKLKKLEENKESLIVRDQNFQNTYINRSSIDPTENAPEFRQSTESAAQDG